MQQLRAHTILLTVAGSRAQGMHVADSDVDLRGVAVPGEAELFGFLHRFEQADQPGDMDVFADLLTDEERAATRRTKLEGSVYALAKFGRLAADCNPNMLEALFCRDAEVRRVTPLGEALRARRDLFLSGRARHSFTGYALGQLRRIRSHRAWLLNPPTAAPSRADFGLPERSLLPKDQLAAAEAAVARKLDEWNPDWGPLPHSEIVRLQGQLADFLAEVLRSSETAWHAAARAVGLDDNLIAVMDRERAYQNASRGYQQYRSWKRRRNPARAALEARHGYDTKHGAHLVRLLRMGREILETGQVHVWRGDIDADELLAIRAGAWSYDALVEFAEREAQALQDAATPAAVPDKPDLDAIDALVVELTERFLAAEGG